VTGDEQRIAEDGVTFDFVVVGGGSAGCVVASRLSEKRSVTVLLIEAGQDTPPGRVDPDILSSYPMTAFRGERWIWPALRARAAQGRPTSRYEQARVLGGGSTINAQAANRGLPRDYDSWRDAGAVGWGWDDVLPYFRKLERDLDFAGPLHGDTGPIPIRRIPMNQWNGFSLALLEAYREAGFAELRDQNGEFGDGYFPPAISNENDRRVSTAMAYLGDEVRRRGNLRVLTGHRVDRIRFDQRVATSLDVSCGGRPAFRVKARHVVLTAGALSTPGLLLRSGVGAGGDLARLGSQVVADVPAVGHHLQDHPALTLCQYLPPSLRAEAPPRRASLLGLRYSSGLAGGSESDMYVATTGRAAWHALGGRLGAYFLWCNRPFSRGRVSLNSLSPEEPPDVELNLLSDERDAVRLADGVRRLAEIARKLPSSPFGGGVLPLVLSPRAKALSEIKSSNAALAWLAAAVIDAAGPLRPLLLRNAVGGGRSMGELLASDKALQQFLRAHVYGIWHASGTCRMGCPTAADTVVDPDGKVVALANVWVADASVMPSVPSANTNIPTIMVAEKISAGLCRSM
jgi:5-(hydroxymethyl)furfural/furfural oxidase